MGSIVNKDDLMQARYEGFLKLSGLTESFGLDPDSDTTDTSSDSECEPEEFEEWLKNIKHLDTTSNESDSEFDGAEIHKKVQKKKSQSNSKDQFSSQEKIKKNCNICLRTFQKDILYQRHLKLHKTGVSCSYPECKNVYSSAAHMRRHLKNHHDIERPFLCSVCSLRFKTEKSFRFHERSQHSISSKSSSSDKGLGQLKPKAFSLAKIKFQCQICQKDFNGSADNLKRHYKLKHQGTNTAGEIQVKNDKKFHCPICRWKSNKPSIVHLQSHSAADLRSFIDKCHLEIRIEKLDIAFEISDEEPIEMTDTNEEVELGAILQA